MLPPTSLNVPTLLLLLLSQTPLTLTQSTTPAPPPHDHHPAASPLSAFDAAELSSQSSLSSFLATQTLIPHASIHHDLAAYSRAIARGATSSAAASAEIPFITALPAEYQSLARGVYSADAEFWKSEGERRGSVVSKEIGTLVSGGGRKGEGSGKGRDHEHGYGTGAAAAVTTGALVGAGKGGGGGGGRVRGVAAVTGTGGAGGGANSTMTGVTTGVTTAPATSPPAGQASGSGAMGRMEEGGVAVWCVGMLGMGFAVMMLM